MGQCSAHEYMCSLSFVGPAMSDAISNLGGGGLSTPYLANLATALGYMSGCLMTLFGGPLINKFGIRYSCMIAAITMPLGGSGYYVNARYNIDWYLLFSKVNSIYVCSSNVFRGLNGRHPDSFADSWRFHFWLPLCRRDSGNALISSSKRQGILSWWVSLDSC
jgi:hypothetical protein